MNHDDQPEIILHLSDFHFDANERGSKKDCRIIVLDSLLEFLSSFLQDNPEWRPTLVCITGDIGFSGRSEDYVLARQWIENLLKKIGLEIDAVILCPGNHDLNRDEAERLELKRPCDDESAQKDLELGDNSELPVHLRSIFANYEQFCAEMGVPPLALGKCMNHLVGTRKAGKATFVCLNSAWFEWEDGLRGRLYAGRPHLEHMIAHKQIPRLARQDNSTTIALMHHPADYLARCELAAYRDKRATLRLLWARARVSLYGHTHEMPSQPDTLKGTCHCLSAGSTYQDIDWPNSFRLIRLTEKGLMTRAFVSDCSSPEVWTEHAPQDVREYFWEPFENAESVIHTTGIPRTAQSPQRDSTEEYGSVHIKAEDGLAGVQHVNSTQETLALEPLPAENERKQLIKPKKKSPIVTGRIQSERDDDSASAWEARANALGLQSRHSEAAEMYRQLSESNPKCYEYKVKQARSLYCGGRLEEAKHILEEVRKGIPDSEEVAILLSRILMSLRQYRNAFLVMENVRASAWDSVEFLMAYIEVAFATGHDNEGLRAIAKLKDISKRTEREDDAS